MKKKFNIKLDGFYRAIKRLVISVIKNDFYGMASEMGFMMVIGIFPFMLFLTAVFGWMGNKSLMDPILAFLSTFMPEQAMELIITVLSLLVLFSVLSISLSSCGGKALTAARNTRTAARSAWTTPRMAAN